MYNRNNIAIIKVASKSTIRPELACVAFYGDRTIATDSFRLIEMSATGDKQEVPVLYPAKSLAVVKLKKGEKIRDEEMPIKPAQDTKGENYPKNLDELLEERKGVKYTEVTVNGAYLAEICTILKELNPFMKVTIKVPQDTTSRPIIITADSGLRPGNEPVQRARALLMPIVK